MQNTKQAGIQSMPEIPLEWFVFETEDFVIHYPRDWEKQENISGAVFCILSGLTSAGDLFRENVNLVTERLTKDINLDKYASLSLKKIDSKYKVKEKKKYIAGGQEYYHIRFVGDDRLQIEQNYFVKNKKAYILTFTYEPQESERIKNEGDKIIRSFRFK
jgi:hypothetical protein